MNGQFSGNRLLSNYNNSFQQNNNGFYQNNNLLRNNAFINPTMQQNNQMLQMQQQQLMQMQQQQMQQMQKIKEMQQMKQMEKLNEVELSMDKEKIKESIIKPIKIERNKQDKIEVERKWKEAENAYYDKTGKKTDYGSEIKQYWSKRTNQPYKNILKNEDYTKQIKSDKDLIIHRVTNKDKEGVEEGFVDLQNKIEKHDDELKVIYSTSKQNEHKKKFEYNHVYKYRVQHDAKDHTDLKEDRITYYKKQQKKEEAGKKKLDVLLDTLISDGIFDKDELSGLALGKSEEGGMDDTKSQDSNSSTVSNISSTSSKKDKYLQRKNKK